MFERVGEELIECGGSIEMVPIWRHKLFAEALGISGDTRDLRVEFAEIPPGEFTMGASDVQVEAWREWREEERTWFGDHERPQVHVTIERPYFIALAPATQSLWDALEARGLPVWDQRNIQGDFLPITGVSWTSLRDVLALTNTRLPSEAEWEYACRSGTQTMFFHGSLEFGLRDYAWFRGPGLADVGGRKPNAFGLHDMLGNVWEWCADAWHPGHDGHDGAQAARGPDDGVERVLRGGAWSTRQAPMVSCAVRAYAGAMSHADDVGVRLAAWGA